MSLLADIYLKTNDWANATHAADIVLKKGKSHNKARLVKAEALFNVCQFEHAMVHFHRGMVSTGGPPPTQKSLMQSLTSQF